MNSMTQGPPADFAGMADRILIFMPIILAGIAVLGLVVWLSVKWLDGRQDARNLAKYVEVVKDVRQSSSGKLSDAEVHGRAFPKYLEVVDTKTKPATKTKDRK